MNPDQSCCHRQIYTRGMYRRQEFFYVPVYRNRLFFTRVFNVFLDRIADVAVFKLELVARTLGQYFVVGLAIRT